MMICGLSHPTHGDEHCWWEVDWEQVGAEHACQLDLNTVNAVIFWKWIFSDISIIIFINTRYLMFPRRSGPRAPAPWTRRWTAARAGPWDRDWTCRSASLDSSRTRLKQMNSVKSFHVVFSADSFAKYSQLLSLKRQLWRSRGNLENCIPLQTMVMSLLQKVLINQICKHFAIFYTCNFNAS